MAKRYGLKVELLIDVKLKQRENRLYYYTYDDKSNDTLEKVDREDVYKIEKDEVQRKRDFYKSQRGKFRNQKDKIEQFDRDLEGLSKIAIDDDVEV